MSFPRLYESYIARAEDKASPEDFHYQVLQQIDTLEGCLNAVGYRRYRPCVMNEKISEATMVGKTKISRQDENCFISISLICVLNKNVDSEYES